MANKIYAVRKGRVVGLFEDWDSCRNSIEGYSGAEYKSFKSAEDANDYLSGKEFASNKKTYEPVKIPTVLDNDECTIYTDGSFSENGIVSFGIVIDSFQGRRSFYGKVDCIRYASMRNILGEICGMMVGLALATDMGFRKYNVVYDYDALYKWVTGEFSANGELQSKYAVYVNKLRNMSDKEFNFIWCKGHNGCEGNCLADKLAVKASIHGQYVDMDKILAGDLTVSDVSLSRLF